MKPDENDGETEFLLLETEEAAGPRPSGEVLRTGARRAYWLAARAGFRRVSYVSAPIAAGFVICGLAVMIFALGSGRGLGIPQMVLQAIFGFLVCEVFGGILGLILCLLGRAIPDPIAAFWGRLVHRPIRFLAKLTTPLGAIWGRLARFWPWLVGVPTFLILAIAFGSGIYAGQMVNRRLADAIAAADRDDPNWRQDDLMAHRAIVPDDENSAIVVARTLKLLPKAWPGSPPIQFYASASPPTEAMKAYDRLGFFPDNLRLDDATADTLRDELAKYPEALQIARTVANFNRGRHEVKIAPSFLDTSLKESHESRDAARFLATDAAIRAQDGDLDGALDSCRAILNVGRSIGDEPVSISQLIRIRIDDVAIGSIQRVLVQGEPSDAALARLQAVILDELSQPLLLNGLRGDRAMTVELIRRIGAAELPIDALSGSPPRGSPPPPAMSPWGKLAFDFQQAIALEWSTELVRIARRPPVDRPALWKAWEARIDTEKQGWFSNYTMTLPLLFLPSMANVGSADLRFHGSLGSMAILLAAERHRRKTGEWPASIDAIDREILANPPIDPYSGKPFLLQRRDGQFIVHSIGPDGVDEHGEYEPKGWMKGGPDDVGVRAWDVPLRKQTLDQ